MLMRSLLRFWNGKIDFYLEIISSSYKYNRNQKNIIHLETIAGALFIIFPAET